MIRYQLGCTNEHRFETWFRDSAAFDAQVEDGLLSCPVCGTGKVAKSIMAPAVLGTSARVEDAGGPSRGDDATAIRDDRHRAVRAALLAIRTKMLSEGQDVGARFPDEARRMHDGVVPERPIRGHATPDEARDLVEDGIMILPIPPLPEELN